MVQLSAFAQNDSVVDLSTAKQDQDAHECFPNQGGWKLLGSKSCMAYEE